VFPKSGYALEEGAGHGIWFANTLMTVKASGEETSGAYAVVDCLLPSGFAPPPHCHRREIETWYILAGELRVTCGDEHWTVGPGAFVCLPRGIPHGFVVSSATRPGSCRSAPPRSSNASSRRRASRPPSGCSRPRSHPIPPRWKHSWRSTRSRACSRCDGVLRDAGTADPWPGVPRPLRAAPRTPRRPALCPLRSRGPTVVVHRPGGRARDAREAPGLWIGTGALGPQ
jgi:quercetin dioxygenase-like cupin family protein